MKLISYAIFLLLSSILTTNAFAGSTNAKNTPAKNTIVKWVDKNGVTHYGDRPPMPDITQRTSELSKEGITKRVNEPDTNKSNNTDKESIEQARRDAALLASYSSEKEIDIAEERNTKIDEITLETLKQKHNDIQLRLDKNTAAEAFFKEKKKPVPKNIEHERQAILSDLNQTEEKIKQKESEIKATRQHYADDKARYVELKAKGVSYKELKVR